MEDTTPENFTSSTKKCSRCLTFKEFSEFNKCKKAFMGLHNHCRQCQKEYRLNWYNENKDMALNYNKRSDVVERSRKRYKQRYHTDQEFREKELEKNRIRRRTQTAKNAAKIQRKNWYEIPHNKIAQNLRSRIRKALLGIHNSKSTEKLLGCSFEEFKKYLESKFDSTMTWENYGKCWHIDHIIPCDFFDFTNTEHQKLCFNYRNTQPMLVFQNLSKNNKITIENLDEFIRKLKIEVLGIDEP
jgi:hypothetical protein